MTLVVVNDNIIRGCGWLLRMRAMMMGEGYSIFVINVNTFIEWSFHCFTFIFMSVVLLLFDNYISIDVIIKRHLSTFILVILSSFNIDVE